MVRQLLFISLLALVLQFPSFVLADQAEIRLQDEVETLKDIGDDRLSVDKDNLSGQPFDNVPEGMTDETPDAFFARERSGASSHNKRESALSEELQSKLDSGEIDQQEVQLIKDRFEKRKSMFGTQDTMSEQERRRILLIEKQRRREGAL